MSRPAAGGSPRHIERTGPFPKNRRVRRPSEYQWVQRTGARIHAAYFVLIVAPSGALQGTAQPADSPPGAPCRLGITASRKVGNAVVRNRLKRVVREWFRITSTKLPNDTDLVVVFRACPDEASWTQLPALLDASLPKIKKLALRSGPSGPHRRL